MPKSRKKRKKGQANPTPLKIPRAVAPDPAGKKTATKIPPAKTVGPSAPRSVKQRVKDGVRTFLFANDGESLFRVVAYSPLFLGAWLVAGIQLLQPVAFVLVTMPLFLMQINQIYRNRDDIPFPENLHMVMYAAVGALAFGIHQVTGSLMLAGLTLGLAVIISLSERLELKTPFSVVLYAAALSIRLPLLAVAGVYSQTFALPDPVSWQHLMLGLVQGCLLSASVIASRAGVFQDAGWKRSKTVTGKDGTAKLRPGPSSQLYSLWLLLGPATVIALTPLGLLPRPFMLCIALVYFLPKLADGFFKELEPGRLIGLKTVHLAGLSVLVVGVAEIFSRFGF